MGLRDRLRLLVRGVPAPQVGRPTVAATPKIALAPRPNGALGWSGPRALSEVPEGATVVFADAFGKGDVAPAPVGPVAVIGTDALWVAAVAERLSAMGHANVGFVAADFPPPAASL